MENEIWKPIPGYEGLYEASCLGRIRSLPRITVSKCNRNVAVKGGILRPFYGTTSNYYQVQLCKQGILRKHLVHRLVAQVFLSDWNADLEVNHIDGNRLNNRSDNLEMCTRQQNIDHSIKHNLKRDYGEHHVHAKLTNRQANIIRVWHRWGIRQNDLAAMFRVSKQAICDIVHNRTYIR